jgi:ribosomal protein S27E
MARSCPRCRRARDFFIENDFDVSCGYCGFVVANITEQFKKTEQDLKSNTHTTPNKDESSA